MLDEIFLWALDACSPNRPRAASPLKGTTSEATIYRGRLSDRHVDSSSRVPRDASRRRETVWSSNYGRWTDEWGRAVFAVNRRGDSNYTYLLDSSGIWSKPPSAEFYKRRAAIAAMAFRYAKHHPGNDYRIAAIIGVGVNDAYPTITVTALDIATYIQKRDPSIPWNVCFTAGAYMETWVDYSRQGFDGLAASEILSQGVSNGLKGKVE